MTRREPGGGLPEVAWSFVAGLCEKSKYEAERLLTVQVSQLVERYRAASAWLFIYTPERKTAPGLSSKEDPRPLKCVLAHNARKGSSLKMDNTLAGVCIRENHTLIYPRILQARGFTNYQGAFWPEKPNTKSAAAVPIHSGDGLGASKGIIGVLILESHHPNAFSVADVEEAAADAELLASDLLFIRELAINELRGFLWHPSLRNWNITRLLNELCYEVTTHAAGASGTADLGMTIWKADSVTWRSQSGCEQTQYYAYALGADRFDSDYLEQRTIPTYKLDPSERRIPLSYVGTLICNNELDFCHEATINDAIDFRRIDKTERMEVEHLYGTPIRDFEASLQQDAVTPATHPHALVIYGYRGASTDLLAELQAEKRQRLASLLSRFLCASKKLTASMAVAKLYGQLRANAITGVNTFNIIRDVLMEVFDADGCSIFVTEVRDADVKLQCVTTSGLLSDGEDIGPKQAFYSLGPDSSSQHTVECACTPGKSLRQNEIHFYESDPSRQRFIEAFTLLEQEHRRSLLLSLGKHKDVSYATGVVRIIRSARKRHFTPEDEDTLRALAPLIEQAVAMKTVFEANENEALDDRIKNQIVEHMREQMFQRLRKRIPPSRHEARVKPSWEWFARSFARLRQDIPCFSTWSRRRIESIIQDLFFCFRDRQPMLALLNVVERNRSEEFALRIHAFHSYTSLQGPEEGSGEPLRQCEGSVGWDAIERGVLVHYTDEHPKYTRIFSRLDITEREGLCLPLMLPFKNGPMRASLHIEWKKPDARHEPPAVGIHELQLIAATGWRLARCALDKGLAQFFENIKQPIDSHKLVFTGPRGASNLFKLVKLGWRDYVRRTVKECLEARQADGKTRKEPTDQLMLFSKLRLKWCGLQLGDPPNHFKLNETKPTDPPDKGELGELYSRMRQNHRDFSPRTILWRFTNRGGIDFRNDAPGKEGPRILGRLDTKDEDMLTLLDQLGVKLSVKEGVFLFPLWTTCGLCGWFMGQFSNSRHLLSSDSSDKQLLRIALVNMGLFIVNFAHWQAVVADRFGDWGIVFAERQSDNGGTEYAVYCDPRSQDVRIEPLVKA